MSSAIHVDLTFALAGFLRRATLFGLVTLALPAMSIAQSGKKGAPAVESSMSWNDFDRHVADDASTESPTNQPQKANCITHHGTLNGGSSLVHHNQPEEPAFGGPRYYPRTTPCQVIPLGYPIAYTLGPGRIVSGLTDASASMQPLPQGPRASCPPESQSLHDLTTTPTENQQ